MLERMLDKLKNSKPESADSMLNWMFEQLNIRVNELSEELLELFNYSFTYQRMIFCAKIEGDMIYLSAFNILDDSEEFRMHVCEICNRYNSNLDGCFVCSYRYDPETYRVGVDVQTLFPLVDKKEENLKLFEEKLGLFFEIRNAFRSDLENEKKNFKDLNSTDVWGDINNINRFYYLVYEHELRSGKVNLLDDLSQRYLTPNDIFLTCEAYYLEEEVCSLSLVCGHEKIINISPSEYKSFNVVEVIQEERESLKNPQEENGLDYELRAICLDGTRLSANFAWISSSKWSDYYNVVISKQVFTKGEVCKVEPTIVSSVFELNRSEEHFEAEVKFMIDDAKDKLESENFAGLTDEQRALVEFLNWDQKEDIYCGMKHFYKKQYVQAVKYLERVAPAFRSCYNSLKKRQKLIVQDIYCSLGYSYSEMGVYSKALYYLRFAHDYGHILGSMEYVNCLVAVKDDRAYFVIEEQLSYVSNILFEEEEDNASSAIYSYFCLLYRHKVRLLIDMEEYDAAEREMEHILSLEIPSMTDFVNEQKNIISERRSKE